MLKFVKYFNFSIIFIIFASVKCHHAKSMLDSFKRVSEVKLTLYLLTFKLLDYGIKLWMPAWGAFG